VCFLCPVRRGSTEHREHTNMGESSVFDARGEAKGAPNTKSTLTWVCCPCSTRGRRNRARRTQDGKKGCAEHGKHTHLGVFRVWREGGCRGWAMSGTRGNAEGVRGAAWVLNTKNAPHWGRFSCSVRAKHGKHAPSGMFFVFGRWERAGETGKGVGSYGSRAGYPPNTKNSRRN